MSRNKYLILLFISFFFATLTVGAASCDYEEKARLNNEVGNIKANYEVLQEDLVGVSPPETLSEEEAKSYVLKVDYIQVNILNLTEDAFIEVTNDYDKSTKTYYYSDTNNGALAVKSPTIDKIVKYKIVIKASDKSVCFGDSLRTINLTLPRRNYNSDYSVCSLVPDYDLCEKYTTSTTDVSFSRLYELVQNEYDKRQKKEEINNRNVFAKIGDFVVEHKIVFIVTGVVVVLGGAAAVMIIKKRRSDEI